MIEKIIHVFENGPYYDDQIQIAYNNTKILPNFVFKFWNKEQTDLFIKNNDIYDKYLVKYCIVCKFGGFFIDCNYVFLKDISVFLNYDFLAVYNGEDIKFFGSKKNNDILYHIIRNKNDESLKKLNIKIINPIYLYPELKNNYYSVVENNNQFIFGANKVDSPWVFSNDKLTGFNGHFEYNELLYSLNSDYVVKKNTNRRKYLIVVAHPDDEILFFGEFIINNSKNVKVLCITNSSNEIRRNEFINILEKYNVDYEMWDYSDLRSYKYSNEIKNRLKDYIKNFERIYTHSLSGETGHPAHILIYKYLFDTVQKNLFVANPYNYKGKISNKKLELMNMYYSQKKILYSYSYISKKEDYLQII